MKKIVIFLILLFSFCLICGCTTAQELPQIAATTQTVYEFTSRLCQDTDITVGRVVTENISCLHDYTLQTSQMRMLESADLIVISGAGLEDFLKVDTTANLCDASAGIKLLCPDHHEHGEHSDHHHDSDPHIWLAPKNAKIMCENICESLCKMYPEHYQTFQDNLTHLLTELNELQTYGEETLRQLSYRELITFHDGFAYFAGAFNLSILKAVEEESGSEASAHELIELVDLVNGHGLPAVFIESNGSVSAADIIAAETGASVFTLDMAMSDKGYFNAMHHNIDTIKEALG